MAVPAFVQAGSGATITGTTGTASLAGATVGNFIVLHLLVDTAAAFPYVSGGSGFEACDGTDNTLDFIQGIQVGATDLGSLRTWVGRVTNAAVSVDVDTNSSTNDMFMRLYEFSGVSSDPVVTNVVESTASQAQGTSTTIGDADVTTTGTDELAIQLVGVVDNQAVGSFTGESGGDWTEAVAEYVGGGTVGVIQLQTAGMAAAGTIGGGSFVMAGSAGWGVQGFAIKSPAAAPGTAEVRITSVPLRW